MSEYILRIYHDRLDPGATAQLGAMHRMIYCVSGSATCSAQGHERRLNPDEAWHSPAEASVAAGSEPTVLWRWEFFPSDRLRNGKLAGAGIASRNAGTYRLDVDPAAKWIMRCDRVNFPPNGEALTHIHAGPGVRCLLKGDMYIDSGGKQMVLTPGSTWIEYGPEEVYARAAEDEATSFVRVMIIPREYQGRSTITYTRPEDQDKPKSQQYQRYVDEPIEL